MDIYIVQPGDDIFTIASKYGVSPSQLLNNNGIEKPFDLVPGQTIVIVYPSQTHTVQNGDTLSGIADSYGVTIMQLLRNNPNLSDREYIYPGETLIISYKTERDITVNGYAYAFINIGTLKKTLPYLTYLSIFNYRIAEKGEIVTYGDDTKILQAAKDYGTIPLLMISTLSPSGEINVAVSYEIIISDEYQSNVINNALNILQAKGFSGVNLVLSNINSDNQKLYIDYITNLSGILESHGYLLFVTINPNIKYVDDNIQFEKINYGQINNVVNKLTFFQYSWGLNTNPPAPVSSIELLKSFSDYLVKETSLNNILIGKPLIAYDWKLPFVQGSSYANSMSLNSAVTLAGEQGSTIQFDESSQTPFFNYTLSIVGEQENHIVWFIDARSIKALNDLIIDYGYVGVGIWNIMVYNQQVYTIVNSRFEIIKLLPDNIS